VCVVEKKLLRYKLFHNFGHIPNRCKRVVGFNVDSIFDVCEIIQGRLKMYLVVIFHKLITARSPYLESVLFYIRLNNITTAQNILN
jgi:hypothetical protein